MSYMPVPVPASQPPATMPLPLVYTFDGGAASFMGMRILSYLVTICTFGICYPWAVVMRLRWQANHTTVNGARMRFTGSAPALFGQWIKWFLLSVVTLGIYSFWVVPAMTKWVVEHQEVVVQSPVYGF